MADELGQQAAQNRGSATSHLMVGCDIGFDVGTGDFLQASLWQSFVR